jgi:hypothetical protein
MSYIKFEKSQVVNLEYSLAREMIRTNRAGSYSSTTLAGCNTRKYHGYTGLHSGAWFLPAPAHPI